MFFLSLLFSAAQVFSKCYEENIGQKCSEVINGHVLQVSQNTPNSIPHTYHLLASEPNLKISAKAPGQKWLQEPAILGVSLSEDICYIFSSNLYICSFLFISYNSFFSLYFILYNFIEISFLTANSLFSFIYLFLNHITNFLIYFP